MKNVRYLQNRVQQWVESTFGKQSSESRRKGFRFMEEATELVESVGLSREKCHQIVDYVFDRNSPGEPTQEVGGVMMTLAAMSTANDLDIESCWGQELLRCEEKADQIRLKDENKPDEVKS